MGAFVPIVPNVPPAFPHDDFGWCRSRLGQCGTAALRDMHYLLGMSLCVLGFALGGFYR